MNRSSSFKVNLLVWWLTFPWSGKQQFFNRDMRLFGMRVFIIRIIWILSNIWVMFICLSLTPTWFYKFVSDSSPNFIAQNLLVGTRKVRRLKFVTQKERRWTGDEISKSFDICRWFVALYLWHYDHGFEHQKITAYINNRFEISFQNSNWTIY